MQERPRTRETHAGLSASEAARRFAQHGPNEIRRMEREGFLAQVVRQMVDPLALLLWGATAISLAEGSWAVAVVIVAVIVLNAGFALLQERQAERATEALQAYLPHRVRARRDGEICEIDATMLVPGDVVLVDEGDRISADARRIRTAVAVRPAVEPKDRRAARRPLDLVRRRRVRECPPPRPRFHPSASAGRLRGSRRRASAS